jgi:hypothetical protein
MEVLAGLIVVATVLVVIAYIAQPFFAERQGEGKGTGRRAAILRRKADLLARRNAIYAALRDLDFDYRTGKVGGEGYPARRRELVTQGVEALQELDRLPALDESPEADPVEAAVLALRTGRVVAPSVVTEVVPGGAPSGGREQVGYCPQCGKPVFEGDRFCGACGAKLRGQSG